MLSGNSLGLCIMHLWGLNDLIAWRQRSGTAGLAEARPDAFEVQMLKKQRAYAVRMAYRRYPELGSR